ncbi:MAG: hypothetical protein M3347_14525 [Armatimonadota bacterium]|nr:hypothetical protein [Armatimonadota bacterium]
MSATQYLEAAKIEELAAQLQREGYEVVAPADEYDLVAMKGDEKLAFIVKAKTSLPLETGKINHLRRRAQERGYNGFRLIVVNPPHEATITIDHLDENLLAYLSNHIPDELARLAPNVSIENVTALTIDLVQAQAGTPGLRVAGDGVVEVSWRRNGNGESENWDFPFFFDVELDRSLQLATVRKLTVDTSSHYELAAA